MSASFQHSPALNALQNLRKRLLDLTARNRLINFRHTKGESLRVIDELPNQLVETLLADKEMRFKAVLEPTEDELIEAGYLQFDEEEQQLVKLKPYPTAKEWAGHLGLETAYEVPVHSSEDDADKHKDTAIQTLLYPYEMEARLKNLLSKAESAIQEMGANILYLGLGFLEWYESTSSDKARIAPLFLVPVRLRKGRLNPKVRTYEYTLKYSGEDIIPNLSLREKLRVDFAMALPELDENTVPEEYFNAVKQMLEDNHQSRWKVRRYITLALLNFSKLLMYLDLDPERWPNDANIVEHPVVSHFLSGYTEDAEENESAGDLGFGEEYLIDEIDDVHAKYPLVDDADSSQHSALIDAIDGKNLVIEGPPGTGKSQTITNLIAAAMAQGKKVLFVAEKLAALEVVRRRLDQAKLGEFCLELHSHKSQKRKVLDEINERLRKHGKYREPKDIEVEIKFYEESKNALKHYVEKINRPWANTGKTLHEIFMAATRYREALAINPEALHPEGYDGNNYDAFAQRRNEDQVETYRRVYQAVANQLASDASLQDHPWYGVYNSDLQIFDLKRVVSELGSWQTTLATLQKQRHAIAQTLGCEQAQVADTLSAIEGFLRELQAIHTLHGDEILESLSVLRGDVLDKAKQYQKLFKDIQNQYVELAQAVDQPILADLSLVEPLLKGCRQLEKLVGQQVKLNELATAVRRLTAIEEQLKQLEEPLTGIRSAIGIPAENTLTLSEAGIRELRTVVDLIAGLSPSLWKHRDERFDNDELDTLLPRLQSEVNELRALRQFLEGIFTLDNLPEEKVIRQLNATLAKGGLFKWFDGEWRAARKLVQSLNANAQVKLSAMLPALNKLAEYSERQERLGSNPDYSGAFGQYMRGIDTDVEALVALRKWYQSVRQTYGVGFGEKVLLGNAILELPPSVAKAVRSLAERGIRKQIDNILNDLDGLRRVFLPVVELRDESSLLVGEAGTLSRLAAAAKRAIHACGSLANGKSLTIADLASRVDQIHRLRKRVQVWQQADFDRKLFHGRLALQVGLKVDNSKGLSMLQHTLDLASNIEEHVKNPAIVDFIFEHPEAVTFDTLAQHSKALETALTKQREAYETFATDVQLNRDYWQVHCGDRIDELILRNQLAMENSQMLGSWLDYVRSRQQLEKLGLTVLAQAVERGDIKINQVEEAYRAGIYDLLAREILLRDAELARFSGKDQEALQAKFIEYDSKLKTLQCEQIAWKIDQVEIPKGHKGAGRVSEYTGRVLLEHEAGKKKRHIPIRQLLQRAGNALVALKPCFMMGPMSVAQYLAPGGISFDMVVMDEASQIKPQDALGAVARGGQLVVVGDPKQLPPTSFFERMISDNDTDPTGIEESESILDATLPMFPARRLRWHYRSQHESLIAFSNQFFYDNDLVLFPSPYKETDCYGIQYSRIHRGCFVNRKNLEEAKIISEAVREHFRKHPEESLGVVAMSAEQKLQIESAIETLAKEDDVFQRWLDENQAESESLFVKNLENVQGDERDIIFISMTYGPQEPGGKVYQRFGPINSDVGWRRLNVLFTRSRKRMHIFSSMGSDDIVASSTSKKGVLALRDFLAYCETGLLHNTRRETDREPDSDFEIAVMDALLKEGFECVPQVGVAGFFIDLAVIDPGKPGRYLMGIECDGATYHSAKSARDRDRLRQAILERLGWRIRRIWSTDWFQNPHGELAPIIRELHELKTPVVINAADDEAKDNKIEEIVQAVEREEAQVDLFAFENASLKEKLIQFDGEVIRKEFPDTPDSKRLLRPSMLEALIEYAPTSKTEFLEFMPSYLRQATEAAEGKYLDQVLEIINNSL